jgi:hypothetical protein
MSTLIEERIWQGELRRQIGPFEPSAIEPTQVSYEKGVS